MQLFDAEILNVVLKFANPDKQIMQDAAKVAAYLSMALDNVVRRHLAAGAAVKDIASSIKHLVPELDRLEKRAGLLAGHTAAINQSQKILSRYTPGRLDKISELQQIKAAEKTAGAVTALGAKFDALGKDLKNVLSPGGRSRLYPATGDKPIGRALVLDVETLGLNKMKHQVVELTATLIEFRKTTGEITNQSKATYTAMRDLEHGFREVKQRTLQEFARLPAEAVRAIMRQTGENAPKRLPPGMTREDLRGQGLSQTRLLRLAQMADVIVGHNARSFDQPRVEELVPQLKKLQRTWIDSFKDFNWRTQGFSSGKQQDIIRELGIDPGQAHRTRGDVTSLISLLGRKIPVSGQTYLKGMLSAHSEPSYDQKIVAVLRDRAAEMLDGFRVRLGDFSRLGWPENLTARPRRPAHSTEYGLIKGAGQAPESTPSWLGSEAITLQNRQADITRYHRYASIAAMDQQMSSSFLQWHEIEAKRKEYSQAQRGLRRQTGKEVRSGDELELAIMSAVANRYERLEPGSYHGGPRQKYSQAQAYSDLYIRKVLSQPWAQSQQDYSHADISKFIGENSVAPTGASAAEAARMLGFIKSSQLSASRNKAGAIFQPNEGAGTAGTWDALSRIILHGFSNARRGRAPSSGTSAEEIFAAKYAVPQGLLTAGQSGSGNFSKPKISFADRIKSFAKGEEGFQDYGEMFRNLFGLFGGKKSKFSDQAQTDRIFSSGATAASPDIKAQMRFDALEARLRRLTDTIESTTRAFEHYRDRVYPQRMEDIRSSYEAKEAGISLGYAGRRLSTDARIAGIDSSRGRAARTLDRGKFDADVKQESFESKTAMAEVEAKLAYAKAAQKAKANREAFIRSSGASKLDPATYERKLASFSAPLEPFELKLAKATYASKTAGITDEGKIEAERIALARVYALQNVKHNVRTGITEDEETVRIANLLRGPTAAQTSGIKKTRLEEDAAEKQKDLDTKETTAFGQLALARRKADLASEQNLNKRTSSEKKAQDELNKRREDSERKNESNRRKGREETEKFNKKETEIAGRSGGFGGGRGPGTGGGGGGDFESRSGFGIGIGFTMLAGYLGVMRDVIKETTIYAARTETLKLVTDQMAKVNGINTDQVMAEVNAMHKLNITTQEAHTTVQKMMFAQLDVAKATQLARVSQDAAILANVNSSEALDRIILGIVTGQTRVLHNMGLQVSMVNVMRQIRAEKRAKGETGEPTEVEKRQAMLNKVLMEGAKIMGSYERAMLTAGKQYNSLQREVQEAQNAIGKEFLPTFGRFVSLTTQGLHFVQENGSAFAKLATAIASVGTAASTVGTLSFIKWIMTSPAVPWQAKLAGAAVGIGTYIALNQDPAEALKTTASEQQDSLVKSIKKIREERAKLWSDDAATKATADWKFSWDLNTQALQSASNAQAAINETLTSQLAEQYNKRVKDLDKYTAAMEGKSGVWEQGKAVFTGSPDEGIFWSAVHAITETGPESIERAKKARKKTASELATEGISPQDIEAEAERQRNREQAATYLGASLLNKTLMAAQATAAALIHLQDVLSKAETRRADTDGVSLRARKMMGSPREKIEIEYEENVRNVHKFATEVLTHQENAKKGGTVGTQARAALDAIYEQIGGRGHIPEGKEKVEEILRRQVEMQQEYASDRDIELGKLNKHTAAQIIQTREQIKLAQIDAGVISGDYGSERAGIEARLKVRQGTAASVLRLLADPDAYKKQVAQNAAGAKVEQINQDTREKQDAKELAITVSDHATERAVQHIEESKGDPRELLDWMFMLRETQVSQIPGDRDRRAAQEKLEDEKTQAEEKQKKETRRAEVESKISSFADEQDLNATVDRIASSRGRSSRQRSLDEIQRTYDSQRGAVENEYMQRSTVTGGFDEQQLKDARARGLRQAEFQRATATVKELETQVENAVSRLHDAFQERISQSAHLAEMQATSSAEEATNAENTHRARIDYINKEYQLRRQTNEARDDVERRKQQESHAAEIEYLESLYRQKQQQISAIRNTSGDLFDIITSTSPNKQRQAKDYGIGLARQMGRTAFSNIAVEVLKSQSGALGGVIKGQTKKDPKTGNDVPTWLGRILAGTPFGKGPNDKQIAAQEEQVRKTEANTTAEEELTNAIKSLDDAVRAANDLNPRHQGTANSSIVVLPEETKKNPLDWLGAIFPGLPKLGGKPTGSMFSGSTTDYATAVNISQVGGTGLRNAVPVYMVDPTTGTSPAGSQAANFISKVLTTGGSGSTSGSGTMGMLASMASGMFSGGNSAGNSNAFSFTGNNGVFSSAGGMSSSGISDGTWGQAGGNAPPGPAGNWPGAGPEPTGMGGGTGSGKSSKVKGKQTNYLGGILMTGAGAYQAYTGFNKGGASGIASGIGGVLTSAAGIASMIPALAPAAPFLAAGAMVADLVGSIFGDSRQQRQIDIGKYLANAKYIAPTQISREMDVAGNLVSTGAHGGLSRDTGIGAFPIDVTQTQYGRTPTKTWGDPNVPEYYTIPGAMQYGNLKGNAQPIVYNITMPISAMDTQDILRRSPDIVAAVKKEIQNGSDVSIAMQQSMFGSGLIG